MAVLGGLCSHRGGAEELTLARTGFLDDHLRVLDRHADGAAGAATGRVGEHGDARSLERLTAGRVVAVADVETATAVVAEREHLRPTDQDRLEGGRDGA